MDALDARNKMSHTYDMREFERVVDEVKTRYLPVIEELFLDLTKEAQGEERDGG